ncbi:MAG TPA: hypothetical protein VLL52_04980 [Anaerolineae bacterium]|nr:hypothetical protein [Anaerolineae bacterium]
MKRKGVGEGPRLGTVLNYLTVLGLIIAGNVVVGDWIRVGLGCGLKSGESNRVVVGQ